MLPKALAEVVATPHYTGVTFRLRKGITQKLIIFSDQFSLANKTIVMTIKYLVDDIENFITLTNQGQSPNIVVTGDTNNRIEINLPAALTETWDFNLAKYEIVTEVGSGSSIIRQDILCGDLIISNLLRVLT